MSIELLPVESDEAKALLTPDWQPIEQHFKRSAPLILKDLYRDPTQILMTNFELISEKIKIDDGLHVAAFEPIGEESVEFFEDLEKFIQIAGDPFGGRYVINPTEDNSMVYLHYYNIGRDPEWFRPTGLLLSELLGTEKIVSEE